MTGAVQPYVRPVGRALYVGCATAVLLLGWYIAMALVAWGSDLYSDEEANWWTPLVAGPIISVYALVAVGLLWGRWRVWRWIPVAVVLSGIAGLLVQSNVRGAGRAYEPVWVWFTLLCVAPVVAGGVTLLAEVLARRRGSSQGGDAQG